MVNPLKLEFGYNLGSWKLNTAKKKHQFGRKSCTVNLAPVKKTHLYGIYIDKEYRWCAD